MCMEKRIMSEVHLEKSKIGVSYSIKKVLKSLFKKSKGYKNQSLESLESIDNLKNLQREDLYEEIEDNAANEKISCYEEYNWSEDHQHVIVSNRVHHKPEVFVPVRYARTEGGTYFWTTNLKIHDVDPICEDQQLMVHTQTPRYIFEDRWAQA